jgi:energy-converting hydrogenase Eha subunit E
MKLTYVGVVSMFGALPHMLSIEITHVGVVFVFDAFSHTPSMTLGVSPFCQA